MGRRRIWKNKPRDVIAKRRAQSAERLDSAAASQVPRLRGNGGGCLPVPEFVPIDYAGMYARLPEWEYAVARRLMVYGASMAGAVRVLNFEF